MKNLFAKIYLYWIVIVAFANLIVGSIYVVNRNIYLDILLTITTLAELPLWVLSIMFILTVRKNKWDPLHLIMPIMYLIISTALLLYGLVPGTKGINPLDISYLPNLIAFLIGSAFYLFQIVFGTYLIKDKLPS